MQERVYDFNEGEKLFSMVGSISTLIKKDEEKVYEPTEDIIDNLQIVPKDLIRLIVQYVMAPSRRHILPFVDPELQFKFVSSLKDRYKDYVFQSPQEVKMLGDSFSSQIEPVNFRKLALEIIDSSILVPLVVSQLIVDYFAPSNQSLDLVLKDFFNINYCTHELTKITGMVAEYENLRQLQRALKALSRGERTFTLESYYAHFCDRKLSNNTLMYALNWVITATNSTFVYTGTGMGPHITYNNYFEYGDVLRKADPGLAPEKRAELADWDYALWCFVQMIMFNHLANTARFTFYLTPEMEKHLYSRVKREEKENKINRMDAEQKYKVPENMERALALLEVKKYSKLIFHQDKGGYDITLGKDSHDRISDLDRREMLQEIVEKTKLPSTISGFFKKEKAELSKIALDKAINESHFIKPIDIKLFINQVIDPLTNDVSLINNKPFQQMLIELRDKLNSFLPEYQSTSSIYLYWHNSGEKIVFQFADEKQCHRVLTASKLDAKLVQDEHFKNCVIFPLRQTKAGEMALDLANESTLSLFINAIKIKKTVKDVTLQNGQTKEQYNIGCSRYVGNGIRLNYSSNKRETFNQEKTLFFEKDHPIFKNDNEPKCLKIEGNGKIILVKNPNSEECPLLKTKESLLSQTPGNNAR